MTTVSELSRRIMHSKYLHMTVPFLPLTFIPLVTTNAYILHVVILAFIYSILASSWNLIFGYTGIMSFAQSAFLGIGAYASALLAMNLGVSPWFGLFLGGAFAGLLSLPVSLPVLRLKESPYIAITTIGFAEICRIVAMNWRDLTGGEKSLWGIPPFPSIGTIRFGLGDRIPEFYLTLILLWISTLFVYALTKSRIGLTFVAIKEDQDAAQSLGINLARNKTLAFFISAFLAGVAGSLYAHYINLVSPGIMGLDNNIIPILGTLIGGFGTIAGPVIGAFIVMFLQEGLRSLGDLRLVMYAVIIILIVIFRPDGLTPTISRAIDRVRSWLGVRVPR